jgi:NAD+ synthase
MAKTNNIQSLASLKEHLRLDAAQEAERLNEKLRQDIHARFRKRGAVVGCSGGVDSSVVVALCAMALGAEKVCAVLMPERESSPESTKLAEQWTKSLGVESVMEDVTDTLEASGCYRRRDEAIRRVFPEYGPGWKNKITLPGSLLEEGILNVFTLTVVSPEGAEYHRRLGSMDFRQIVAASNFKQRTRMAMLYYHAELRNYAVVGTGNRNEHELGFFVKYGDGAVDISPILHLYKSQIYQLARYLDVPEQVRAQIPTSDTYSAGSSQEEFFFRLSFDLLDAIWDGWERGISPVELAGMLELTEEQVQHVIDDIVRKQRTTQYLRTKVLAYHNESEVKTTNVDSASRGGAQE